MAALRAYRWREQLHEVIFQILCDLPADLPALARELTRHGFPDAAWESYFVPQDLAKEEVRRLVDRLLSPA